MSSSSAAPCHSFGEQPGSNDNYVDGGAPVTSPGAGTTQAALLLALSP